MESVPKTSIYHDSLCLESRFWKILEAGTIEDIIQAWGERYGRGWVRLTNEYLAGITRLGKQKPHQHTAMSWMGIRFAALMHSQTWLIVCSCAGHSTD
jgi:hypothetical protein